MKPAFWALLALAISFLATLAWKLGPELTRPRYVNPAFRFPSPLELASLPTATRFDFPLGSENGAMSYNAQRFTQNHHLGDDLNGIGGENSDLGDPIYSVADGRVLLAREGGPGWGKVVILLHAYIDHGRRKYVESYYGHVQTMLVHAGEDVKRGQQVATVGTANGRYFAHLHFEMREFVTPFVGPGYRKDTRGWLNPTAFIEAHRGAPADDVGRMREKAPNPKTQTPESLQSPGSKGQRTPNAEPPRPKATLDNSQPKARLQAVLPTLNLSARPRTYASAGADKSSSMRAPR